MAHVCDVVSSTELIGSMPSPLLKRKLDLAIKRLMPLFGVSSYEEANFKKPRLVRHVPKNYPKHPKNVPAYGVRENFFYFPVSCCGCINMYNNLFCLFNDSHITHEAAHYVHSTVFPDIQKFINHNPDNLCLSFEFKELREITAEYACLALGVFMSQAIGFWDYRRAAYNLYQERGPEFLPILARMTLDQSVTEGITVRELVTTV
jgi:hypothetical protein